MRVGAVEKGEAQNVRYTDTRGTVKETELAIQQGLERIAKVEEAHPWVSTITATALRAQIPSTDKAIELETSRGGCKSRCKQLMDAKADLERRIALAEEVQTVRDSVAQERAKIVGHRTVSAKTVAGDNTVKAQTFWVSQLAALSLNPDMEIRTGVEIAISFLLAIGGVAFAPTCLWLWARLGVQLDGQSFTVPAHAMQRHAAAATAAQQGEAHVEIRRIGEGAPRPEHAQLAPIEVDVPIHVRTNVDVQSQGQGELEPTRRITRVRENAFARRIADITAHMRSKAAA